MYDQLVTTALMPRVDLDEPNVCAACDGNQYDESGQACTVCSGLTVFDVVEFVRFLCFWRR